MHSEILQFEICNLKFELCNLNVHLDLQLNPQVEN
jgi:hypothetical protein